MDISTWQQEYLDSYHSRFAQLGEDKSVKYDERNCEACEDTTVCCQNGHSHWLIADKWSVQQHSH